MLARARPHLAAGTWTVLDQGLFAGSNFALNVLLARWLDATDYGAFTLVSFAALLLVGVFHTGLLAEPMLVYGSGTFKEHRSAYVRMVVWGHAWFALAAIPLVAAAGVVAALVGHAELTQAFFALAAAQGGILLMWLMRRASYVFLRPAAAVTGGVVYAVVGALGLVGLKTTGLLTPATAILLMGAAGVVAAGTIVARLGLHRRSVAPDSIRADAVQAHRDYGGWAAATGGLEWVQGVLPFLVLPVWHGLEATGAFRALFNLVMPVMHVYGALSLLLVPTFVRARADGRLPRALAVALGVVGVLTCAYGLAVALGGRWLLDALYDGRYTEHAALLGLFALYPIVGGAAAVFGALRRASEQPKRVFRARAGAAALMATAGTALIHALGLLGAILADVLASVAEVALLMREPKTAADIPADTPFADSPMPSVLADIPHDVMEVTGDVSGGEPRLKVLLSAFACIPGWGTEPGVGWNFAREMARHHDVWVLTYTGFRKAIEAELRERPVPGLHFAYHALPFEHPRHAEEGQFRHGVAEQAHYYAWQLTAARVARALHTRVGFDLAHHVTFVKYWAPCALARVPVPFIWGPVGGGESAPHAFYRWFSRDGLRYERQRDAARALMHMDPNVRRTAQRAALTFATTEETGARVRALGATRVEVRSAIGLSAAECARLGVLAPPDDGPVRFLSIGRLLAFKGYEFGLRAYAEALRMADDTGDEAMRTSEYWLLGDGPERARLEALAGELGLGTRVRFLGNVPRPEVMERLGQAHALVHPSVHESGGGVCLEAMAAGRPVLCFDLGGSAVHVSPECGVLVPAMDPAQAVPDLAQAMRALASDPERRRRLGAAGRRRVNAHFQWEDKVADMARRYWSVAGLRARAGVVRKRAAPVITTPSLLEPAEYAS